MRLRCSVCRHSKVLEINDLLTIGTVTGAEIAAKFGLGEMAVSRHRRNCIGKLVSKAMARRNDGQGDRLLSLSQKWIDHADRGMDSVAANNDYRTLPGLLTAGLKAVETVARLEGRPGFGDAPAVNATVQIALVKLPALGGQQSAAGPVIDVSPVRGHLTQSAEIMDGDCELAEAGKTNNVD